MELRKILTEMNCGWNTLLTVHRSAKNVETTISSSSSEIPHTPLAVVSGAVIPINPIPPAPAIVAKSGEFARTNVKTIRKTSTDADGNFVITTISTRTVLMGTDEYKALVIKAFAKTSDSVAV
jgi:hypothetical protein